MKQKIFFISLLMILLLSFYAAAFETSNRFGYSETGYYASKLQPINKIFPYSNFLNSNPSTYNNDFQAILRTSVIAGNNYNMILSSSKIDNNLIDVDVIAYDETNQRFMFYKFDNNQITLKTTYALGAAINSSFQLFDYNSDNKDDIVYSTASEIRVLSYNDSNNAFQSIANKSLINIVGIRCYNASGFYNYAGIYNDSQHCTFLNSTNFLYEYNISLENDYLNNMSICQNQNKHQLQNGLSYPPLISNIDNDNYIEYTAFCVPNGANSFANSIAVQTKNANSQILFNSSIVGAVNSNICLAAGSKNTPTGLSVINYDGYNYGIVYSGLWCDDAASGASAQQYQKIGYKIINQFGAEVAFRNTSNSANINPCSTDGICVINGYLPLMIADISQSDAGQEVCIGASGIKSANNYWNATIYCYGETQAAPYYTVNVSELSYTKSPFNSYFTGVRELSNTTLSNNIIFATGQNIYRLDYEYNINQSIYTTIASVNNYYFTTLNNDNFYDIISLDNDELIASMTDFVSAVPVIIAATKNTGSPTCINNDVTYSYTWYDANNELIRIRTDCYGNGNYTAYSAYSGQINSPITQICRYNTAGSFNPVAEISNSAYNSTFALPAVTIISGTPPACSITGENTPSTGGGASGDFSVVSIENTFSNTFSGWSVVSKMLLGLLFLIGLIIALVYYDINKTIITVVSVLAIITLTALSLFPAWIFFLIVIIVGLGLLFTGFMAARGQ
jgi:hypothetical protein